MTWSKSDDALFKAEIERRYAERTPPSRIDEADPSTRVVRSEMRNWATDNLGKAPPETDRQWLAAHSLWYQDMALAIIKNKDPGSYAAAKKKLHQRGKNNLNSRENLWKIVRGEEQ